MGLYVSDNGSKQFEKLSLDDIPLAGKKILVRVDFNVPIDDAGKVRDFTRIKASLPTIHNILDYESSAILLSHLGRPGGKVDKRYTLKPVAVELGRLLGLKVKFAPDCIGPEVERMVSELAPGEVLLLENVRFHSGEATDDSDFAAELAKSGDLFVNDAFGAAHRRQASICAITKYFPTSSAAGRLMMREIRFLDRALSDPRPPYIGIVGGAKISNKLKTIRRLLPSVDKMLIGGGMAYTMIKAMGGNIGDSLCEDELLPTAKEIMTGPEAHKIVLPKDSIVATDLEYGTERQTHPSDNIPEGWRGLDLGREARAEFVNIINGAGTVFWNGPVGLFECEPFATGTRAIARNLVNLTANGGIAVVGGGDSMAALRRFNLHGPMTHVSTGGGSLLEYIEGKPLPGIEALSDRSVRM